MPERLGKISRIAVSSRGTAAEIGVDRFGDCIAVVAHQRFERAQAPRACRPVGHRIACLRRAHRRRGYRDSAVPRALRDVVHGSVSIAAARSRRKRSSSSADAGASVRPAREQFDQLLMRSRRGAAAHARRKAFDLQLATALAIFLRRLEAREDLDADQDFANASRRSSDVDRSTSPRRIRAIAASKRVVSAADAISPRGAASQAG